MTLASAHLGESRLLPISSSVSSGLRSTSTQSSRPDHRETRAEGRAMSFEKFFQASFVAFLDENFRSDAEAASFFKVRERTAENWRNGHNKPGGKYLAMALREPRLRASLIRHMTGDAA